MRFKPTAIAVFIFICCFLWIRSCEADTLFEVSPAFFFGGDYYDGSYGFVGTERFKDKYDLSVVLIKGSNDLGNRAFQVTRVVHYKDFEMGIGYSWWGQSTPQAWTTDNTFNLHIGYEFGQWGVRWRHWSTAGTTDRNRGIDMLTVGYRFK